ncbi:MAG: DUF1214 domain-containing protein [Acidimicrobiales bacterium]
MIGRRGFLVGAGATGGLVLAGGLAACSSDSSSSDGASGGDSAPGGATTTTAAATDPLVDAFYAGVPLVVTMRTMQTFAGLVGVNRLFATKALTNADSRFVVAPNNDTLYAIAVLDLSIGARALTLPAIADRYHVVQILDAWMGQVGLLGTRATGGEGGTWAIAREGAEPDDLGDAELLACPTDHCFVLARIRATAADVDEAAAVAGSIRLEPFGPQLDREPLLPAPVGPPNEVGGNGAASFDELGDLLGLDGPVGEAATAALAEVDDLVGPGRHPTEEAPERTDELADAVSDGLDALDAALAAGSDDAVDGWAVRLDLGMGGDDLPLADQALIARSFWGPVPAEEAVYPRCVAADDGEALDGSKRYRIVLPGDDLPPVDAFWSYTVYGEDLFFVPNPIDRFSLSGETPGLVAADDGTITIALQPDDPADDAVNWLPTPDGPFTLIMRCYLPQRAILDGEYRYPPVEVMV